jgi:hypothetical protein
MKRGRKGEGGAKGWRRAKEEEEGDRRRGQMRNRRLEEMGKLSGGKRERDFND